MCNFSVGQLPVIRAAPEKKLSASEFALEKFGFKADVKQKAVLDSTAKMGILNCSRQWGKSTVTAVKAVERAWNRPGSLILVASPCERQSGLFLDKAIQFAQVLGVRRRGDGFNKLSLQFPNGSRIVGLPGTEATIRGFSAVSLILIDEAARVSDAMYKALRPMLAVGNGDLWMMSTPNGKRGFFWETWALGGEEWERIFAPATECERISGDFLERERRAMGARTFAQEFMGEFMDNGGHWFSRDAVERAFRDEEVLRF